MSEKKSNSVPKPLLKWVGGKTQILQNILNEFPTEIDNYHEIFLGGGSVLIGVLTKVKNSDIKLTGTIYAYDANEDLINLYKGIQSDHINLYNSIQELIKDFKDLEEFEREKFYYQTRNDFNKFKTDSKLKTDILKKSAMFVFLNKTCFRGLYRIGPNGFNVPYGHYKNPEIINKEHLESIHFLIKDVVFKVADFTESLDFKDSKFSSKDYIYLDPPYAPETEKSFVSYTKDGFGIKNHLQLFKICEDLTKSEIKFMLSNSDVKLVRENFDEKIYHIIQLKNCKRSINSKNPDSKTTELLIKNY